MGLSLTIPPNIGDFRLVSSPIKWTVWCHVARMRSPQASHILRPKPFGFPFLFRSNRNGRIQVVSWTTTQQNPTEPNRTQPAIVAQQQPRCVLLRHFAVPVAPWLLVSPIFWYFSWPKKGTDGKWWDRPISKVCLASHGPLHQAHEPQKTSGLTSEGFQIQVNLSTACHSYRWPILYDLHAGYSPKFSQIFQSSIFQGSDFWPVSNPMPWLPWPGKALSPASWRWLCMVWCWRGSIPSYSTLAQG